MKTKAFYFLTMLFMSGCEVLTPVETFLPKQNDAAILAGMKYVSHTSEELIMETDLIVLNTFYSNLDNDYLSKEDIEVVGDGTYLIESFDIITKQASGEQACLLLLLDQSASFFHDDPFNSRSQSLSKFAYDAVIRDQLLVGAASKRDGDTGTAFSSGDFDHDGTAHSTFIYSLSTSTAGTGSLAATMEMFMDRLALCEKLRKELVIFYKSEWLSQPLREQLAARAKAENASIHLIGLGDDRGDEFLYSGLATETQGIYMGCPSVHEANKVFSELARLISGDRTGYRIRLRFTTEPGNPLLPGSTTRHTILIVDPYSGKSYNPVYMTLTIPA